MAGLSIKIYEEEMRQLATLSCEQGGKILFALLCAELNNELPELDATEKVIFNLVKGQTERARELSEKRSQARKGANQNAIIDGTNADKRVTKSEQTPTSDNQISTTDGTNADTNTSTSTSTSTSTNTSTSTQINTPALPTIGGGATNTNAPNESDAEDAHPGDRQTVETCTTTAGKSTAFDSFWAQYPKKVGKEAARRAWNKIKPNSGLRQKITEAITLAKQSGQWRSEHGRFIPNPATWLNQGRWDDELTPEEGANRYGQYNAAIWDGSDFDGEEDVT